MIRITASSVINAPIETVWVQVRDFGAINQWLPGVAESVIEDGADPDKIGATRRLTFADGGKMREQLLALSDADTTVTFAIIESELPIENYVATIRLQRVTDGERSFITWSGEFDANPGHEADMARRMREDIYQPGFDSLKQRFEVRS